MTDEPMFCKETLPVWELACWGPDRHGGSHHGGNFAKRFMGSWGAGYPTHVDRMPPKQ